jgi:hypothetical protein
MTDSIPSLDRDVFIMLFDLFSCGIILRFINNSVSFPEVKNHVCWMIRTQVMHFWSSCKFSVLVCVNLLVSVFLTLLTNESTQGVNNKVVENFLSFVENLGSPLFDAYNSSYDWNNSLLCRCLDSMYALKLIAILDVACACSKLCGPS